MVDLIYSVLCSCFLPLPSLPSLRSLPFPLLFVSAKMAFLGGLLIFTHIDPSRPERYILSPFTLLNPFCNVSSVAVLATKFCNSRFRYRRCLVWL